MTVAAGAPPRDWDVAAHTLWQRGQGVEAIQTLLTRLNTLGQNKPVTLVLQLAYYFFLRNDYQAAVALLEHQAVQTPDHLEVLLNLAVCYGRLGRHTDAVAHAQTLRTQMPDNALVLDILANSLHKLGHDAEAREVGTRSLSIKNRACNLQDTQDASLATWSLPTARAENYARCTGKFDVIAYSLWGAAPRYLRGALRNLLLAPDLYPNWRVRFYLDRSVPAEFIELLDRLGAEIMIQPDGQSLRQKLCWRFQVANDPAVGRFLVRDADSVISVREVQAVTEWLASDAWFHVIRDWWTHTDLVLAGMWGGVAGVLPSFSAMLNDYTPPAVETPNIDQWFLRDRVWPYLRQSCLMHDRCFDMPGSRRLPGPIPAGDYHIGQDEYAVRREAQERFLRPWLARYACLGGE